MCLSPITIRNPTENIYHRGSQQLSLQVPCNKCAECVKAKRNEWYFRTFQQVTETLNKGGYILFDTLTYREDSLPHLSDFVDIKQYNLSDCSCFNHTHFKLFLKNLRRQLKYHYGNNEFKYFLTSEYGVDDRYTHRPHYHILFFVTNGVHPLTFSKLVSKCWRYGRTDGIDYQPLSYVSQHIYGYNVGFGINTSSDALVGVCMYVSKYITKSSKFQKTIYKRLNVIRCFVDDEEFKTLERNISMFHRQSRGFGAYYLTTLDNDHLTLAIDGKCRLLDPKKVVREYPLPMYYKRKLFYVNCKREDGRRFWQMNDFGKSIYIESKLKQISTVVTEHSDIIVNNPTILPRVENFLSGRTLREYAIYLLFYKGRMRCSDSLDMHKFVQRFGLSDTEYNLYDWLNLCIESLDNNQLTKADLIYRNVEDGLVYVPRGDIDQQLLYFVSARNHFTMPYDSFVKLVTFNQFSCFEFRDFDNLFCLFESLRKSSNKVKQETFDYLEDYKEKMKLLKVI